MVDVTAKDVTERTAIAEGVLVTRPETLELMVAVSATFATETMPASASMSVASGPGRSVLKSRTRIPASGCI